MPIELQVLEKWLKAKNYRILEDKAIATNQSKLMEEITSTVAVPFRIGNLIQKESTVTTHMEITGLKLMANTATTAAALILNPSIEGCQSYSVGNKNHTDISPKHQVTVSAEVKENQVGADSDSAHLASEMVTECGSSWVLNESHNQQIVEDEFMLANNYHCVHTPRSQSVASDKSCLSEESAILTNNCSDSDVDLPIIIKVDDHIQGKSSLVKSHAELEAVQNMVSAAIKLETEHGSGSEVSDPKPSAALHEMPEKQTSITSCFQNALELSGGPLWGLSSVCGRRQEMEDAVAVMPQLFQVPSQMLMDDRVNENKSSPAHFFGVYDGHGGCQVCLKILCVSYTICCILELDPFHYESVAFIGCRLLPGTSSLSVD